jgi:hypothetical protein
VLQHVNFRISELLLAESNSVYALLAHINTESMTFGSSQPVRESHHALFGEQFSITYGLNEGVHEGYCHTAF